MSSLYDDLDLDSLIEFRNEYLAKHLKKKSGKDTNNEIDLGVVETELKLISKAIIKVKAETPKSVDSTNPVDKNLEKDIRDKVLAIPIFTSGSDVAVFLHECTAIFKTLVEGNPDDRVEKEFVRKCKLRLDSTYLTVLCQQSTSVNTFKEFTDYMNNQYQSDKSAYQYFESIFDMERRADENYANFHARVSIAASRAFAIIDNKWAKHVVAKNSQATEEEKKNVDYKQLVIGQVVLKSIKRNEATYNQLINDLDSTWTGGELANKADSFDVKKSAAAPSVPATVLHVKNKTQRTCPSFLKSAGKQCWYEEKWGKKCKLYHDEDLKANLGLSDSANTDSKPSDGRKKGNAGRKKHTGKQQSGRQQSKGSTNPSNEDTGGDFTSHHTLLDPSNVTVFPNGPGQ